MNNISIKGLELKAIFALILPSLFLGVADNFSDNVFWGVAMLLVLGALVGLILPNIVSTWLNFNCIGNQWLNPWLCEIRYLC